MPTDEELKTARDQACSMRELLILLGYTVSGATSNMVKKRLFALGLDVPQGRKKGRRIELVEILVENSEYTHTKELKGKLLKANLLTEVCANCTTGPLWQGKPLVLQLDHVNGCNTDNRIENLRLLCPNCHTQTETWGRKR